MPSWLRHEATSSDALPLGGMFSAPGQPFVPPTDVVEYSDRVVIRMEVPGVDRDELMIVQEDRFVIVQGKRKRPPHEREAQTYRLTEIQYGPFGRVFEFPDFLDLSQVRADYDEGFLTIRIPKTGKAPRQPISLRIRIEKPQ